MAKKLLTKSEVIADISTNINDEVEQGISGKKLAGVLTNMVNYSEDASQILLSSGSAEHSLQMLGEVNVIDEDDTVTTYVNDSISMMSVTLGIGNSAGIGGWKYNAIRVGEENVDFYLTTNTNIDTISINPEEEPIDNTLLSGFTVGDKLSLIIKGVSYNDIFTIKYINNSETAVNGNKISVSRAEFDAVFGDANLETLFNSSGINSSINYSLFCLAKPSNVNYNSDIGKAAFAVGVMNNANNLAANASGYKTNAYGMFSTAEGFMNNASGLASHAEGRHTIATNDYEHSEGKYNLSIKDKTIHTVGIGYTTYSTDIQDDIVSRINAEEIHSNGDKYIYGIGGYDGTNSQTEGIKTVQEVVKDVEKKLDNCVDLTSEQTITAAKTFSGGVSMNNTRIRKVKEPTEDTDATNKGYVDSKVDVIDATKQDVLTAGKGIVIDDSNTISINFDPDIFKVVSTLPETPDAGDEKKIHLVPSEDVESGNAYDEYVYVDGSWEKIGSFRPSIDLSDFVDFTSEQTITATKTFSGGINMNSTKILNVATPTNGNDAANKQYVDTQILDNVKTISTSTAKDMEELRALIEDINNKIDATKPQLVEGITDKYHRGHLVKIKLKASFTGVDSLPDTLPSINFAPIKYNKEAVLSLTVDDCHASAFCNIWAAINGRPVASNVEGGASKNYFYHANQYLNGDIPNEIKGKSYNRMVYNDGLGGKRRYNYGIAVWPSVRTNNGSVQMESESMVDKNANNLYRFMSPYFTWTDYDLIKKYGVDLYQHNIGKEDYGSDKIIYNVITGIVGDSFTAFKKGGRFISAVMEPDGNAVYCDAAKQVKLIDVIYNQSTGVDMIPYNNEDMYKKIYKRYFDNIESVKSKIEALLSKDINEREWYHFCFHSVYDNTCDLLQFIHQTYGDRIWFASAQEVYEYQYMKKWADIKAVSHKIENGQYIVSFEIYLPFQENFTHKDMSINLSLPVNANLLNVECTSGDIPELEYIGINDTKTMIHVGVNEDLIDNIEYFVSKYESTGDEQWKNDAIIDISRLREDLKQNYLSRLNKEPVYVTDIQISLASSSINKGETVNGTVTALPSNNTQMSDILLNIAEGATITSKSISGNIINFTVIGDTVGTTTITATIGDITNSVTLEINEVQTPIAQVEVSNLIVSPSSPNVGDNLEVSWTASKNGVTLQNGYIKIWTNLTPMPDTWTSVSNFSHTLNAEESLTTIYVKVASNVDGTDASATSACTVKVNTPVQTVNAPIYMLSLNAGGVSGSNWHRYDTVFKHHVNTLYALSTAQFGGNGPVDDNGNGTSLRPMTTEQIRASECVTELLSLNSATWNIGNMSEKYSKIMTLFDETTNERGAVRAIYGLAYGSDTMCALGWTLDNGRYKIRLMSTYDSVSNDPYASCNYQTPGLGKIYFNKEDITSQLGTSVVSFADNTTWSDPVEVNIENGELIISIFNKKTSNASERTRMNIWGLEITKL